MSVTLLVGTTKGAFLLERSAGGRFTVRGPFCNGWSINHFASGGGTIWAGGGNGWFGAGVWRSTDGYWFTLPSNRAQPPAFPLASWMPDGWPVSYRPWGLAGDTPTRSAK